RNASGAVTLRAALVAAALAPVLLLGVGRLYRAPVADALLRIVDPRRTLRKTVIERVVRQSSDQRARSGAGPDGRPDAWANALIDVARAPLAEITPGAQVRFLKSLSPQVASYLSLVPPLHVHASRAHDVPADVAAELRGLSMEMIVPVRSRRRLFGV